MPAQSPPPEVAVPSYPSPRIQDRLLIEEVNTTKPDYKALEYGTPHPDLAKYPGFVLCLQKPSRADLWVQRFYVNERIAQDTYNANIDYDGDSNAHPVFTRTYLERRDSYTARTKLLPLTGAVNARVTHGGSGYTTQNPAVAFQGSTGDDATGHAIVWRGAVVGIVIETEGAGYEDGPIVVIAASPTGDNATALAFIQPLAAILVKEVAERMPDDPQDSLYLRVTRVYETLPGQWLPDRDYDPLLGPIQVRRRAVVNAGQVASQTLTVNITYKTRDESSIVSWEIERTNSTGDGSPGNPAYPILIADSFDLERGAVQTTSQLIVKTGAEVGIETVAGNLVTKTEYVPYNEFLLKRIIETWTLQAETLVRREFNETGGLETTTQSFVEAGTVPSNTITAGAVNGLTLDAGGSGYLVAPIVSFTGGSGTGAAANTTIGSIGVESVTVSNGGSGYSQGTVGVSFSGGAGSGAAASAVVGSLSVTSIPVAAAGSGYTVAPTVSVFSSGPNFLSVEAVLATTSVASIAVSNGGTAYLTAPTVVVAPPVSGTQALATAIISSLSVQTLTIVLPATGFTSNPTVAFSGGAGTGAAATAIAASGVASIAVTNVGVNYNTAPLVTIALPNYGTDRATATATVSGTGSVTGITVTHAGSGYTAAPTVTITPRPQPGIAGSGATADATLAAAVLFSLTITSGGAGYTSAPTVAINGGGIADGTATATATIGGVVTDVTVTNAGTGYTSAPAVTFTGNNSAIAAATLTPRGVGSFTVLYSTSGYTTPPVLTVLGGDGTGAAAGTPVLGGAIIAVNVTARGTGYTSAPGVSITGGVVAATATSTIGAPVTVITKTADGSGYTHPPTVVFTPVSSGPGSGASATPTTGTVVQSQSIQPVSELTAKLLSTIRQVGIITDEIDKVDAQVPGSRATVQYYLVFAASPIPADTETVTYERRRFAPDKNLRIEVKTTYAIPAEFSETSIRSFAFPSIFLEWLLLPLGEATFNRPGFSDNVPCRIINTFSTTRETFVTTGTPGVDYPIPIDEAQWKIFQFSGHGLTDEDAISISSTEGDFAYFQLPKSTPSRAGYLALAKLEIVGSVGAVFDPVNPTPYVPPYLRSTGTPLLWLINGSSEIWKAGIYRTSKIYTVLR